MPKQFLLLGNDLKSFLSCWRPWPPDSIETSCSAYMSLANLVECTSMRRCAVVVLCLFFNDGVVAKVSTWSTESVVLFPVEVFKNFKTQQRYLEQTTLHLVRGSYSLGLDTGWCGLVQRMSTVFPKRQLRAVTVFSLPPAAFNDAMHKIWRYNFPCLDVGKLAENWKVFFHTVCCLLFHVSCQPARGSLLDCVSFRYLN